MMLWLMYLAYVVSLIKASFALVACLMILGIFLVFIAYASNISNRRSKNDDCQDDESLLSALVYMSVIMIVTGILHFLIPTEEMMYYYVASTIEESLHKPNANPNSYENETLKSYLNREKLRLKIPD